MELQTSPSKQRRYKEAKLNLERTPQKATRVDIGFAFPRWTALRRDRCFQSDAELASFLLDSYERGAATPSSMNGKPAVSEFDASRGTERRLYSKDSSGVSEKKSFRPDEPRDQSFVSPTRAESEELVQTHVRRSLVFPAEDQQDQQDPVLLHIKEEQEELLTSQDGEQLNGLEETDNTRLPFSAVIVKSEDDEEKPQCSQLYQSQIEDDREAECQISCATKIKTETDGEDCGGAEPTRNPASNNLSQQNTDAKTSVSCETEVSIGADDEGSGNDTDDWQEPLTESGSETEDSDSGCKESRARAFACSECGKRFRYKWSLQRHMTGHSGKMSSSSFANKKCFTVRQTADLQIKVHTGEKPYGCSLCGQRFRDQYNLKRHMRIHTGEKPFGCGVCGKRFNGEGNLKIHKRVHTGEKPFGCGVCGKKFKQKSHFKKHIMVHTEERPFSCDVCGKAFKWRIHMKTHMRIHSEEKLFGCNVCSRRFNCERNLKIHMRGHTDERPFGCDVCGRRFNCNRNLKIHKKVHTGERPFACGVCGKKFSQVGARNRHRSVHTEEKPFACELCGQRFNREGNLERHKRVHTGEKPFVCDVCGQKFTREGSLKRHMRNKAINHLHVVKD